VRELRHLSGPLPHELRAEVLARGVSHGRRPRRACTAARVHRTDRVARGICFLSFHFPETHANALSGPQRDPSSDCPEDKLTAVRIVPAAEKETSA
jgi:formate dehydrogenase major subunit